MKITRHNYQEEAHKFASYEHRAYPYLGLQEEIGELVGKIAKSFRGDKELGLEDLKKEAGDCMWMTSEIDFLEGNNILKEAYGVWDDYNNHTPAEITEDKFVEFLCGTEHPTTKALCVMFYYGLDLEEILQMNIDKLQSRLERGVIKGDGDLR